MKSIRMRLAAAATSVALITGASGVAIVSAAEGGPTVTLSTSHAAVSNDAPVEVTALFSEAVTGLTSDDITVTNGAVSDFSGSGTSYTFDVTPTADGAFTIKIDADKANNASSTGNVMSNTLSLAYDTTAPNINSVAVSGITQSCATVGWASNESVAGQISYGTTASYGSTATSSASGTHSSQICGLNASTTYNFSVMATDEAGNVATSTNATFATLAEEVNGDAPVISGVTVTVNGTSSATIRYTTDIPSTGFVSYGTSTAYGTNTTAETTASTTHSVTLTGLTAATTYNYRISQTNDGNTATTTNATFTTHGSASTTPLAHVGTEAVRTTATADGTFENGFKWILTFTVPESESNLQMRFTDFTSGSNSIPAANNIRISSAQSNNATSTSAIVSTNNEYGTVMTLSGDGDANLAGRQVQVMVEVKVPFGTPPATGYTTTFGVRSATPTP